MAKMKYRSVKAELDGHVFDSKKESSRYSELVILERAGKIKDLVLQPKFQIVPSVRGYRARYYIADFQYTENGKTIVEDVKSEFTKKLPVYTLKRQLFFCAYPDVNFKEII